MPNVLVSSDDGSRGKPAHDGYLIAAERLGAQACACLVVEDSVHGIAAGRAAGMSVSGVRPAYDDEHIVEVAASGLVTVTGGKCTTYSKMAQDATDAGIGSWCAARSAIDAEAAGLQRGVHRPDYAIVADRYPSLGGRGRDDRRERLRLGTTDHR